jgi:hypothetical protein
VGRPGFEPERPVERDDLRPAAGAAIAPPAQLDLAGEGDQPTGRPAVRLHRAATAGAGDGRREGGFEPPDEHVPEPDADLGERADDRSLERTDIGVLGREADLERDRTLHREPSVRWCFDNTDSVTAGLPSSLARPAQTLGCLPSWRTALTHRRGADTL